MTQTSTFWAIVPAAGVGSRMGAAIPKQYLTLHGKRVIDWTLSRLLQCDLFDGIMVATSATDAWWPTCEYAHHPLVHSVTGGQARADTVRLSLQALQEKADAQDWVLVHDAARPCVDPADVKRLVHVVLSEQHEGGLLGVPVADTLKWLSPAHTVEKTLDRTRVWRAFTPQMFRVGALYEALLYAQKHAKIVTDEASAMEMRGVQPMMLEGRSDNIKITRNEDLAYAEQVLRQSE